MNKKEINTRRNFISAMAMGVTASSLSILTNPIYVNDSRFFPDQLDDADDWFKNIKGKHRIVYDGAMPNNGFPVIWEKYQLGDVLKITDSQTQKVSVRNLYYDPKPGDFPLPDIQGMKNVINLNYI